MNRDAAIEAGARVSFESRTGYSWDEQSNRVRAVWRKEVAYILDAAAPHLMGEPVGYVVEDASYGVVSVYSDHGLSDARDEASEIGGRVLALVPVEDQPVAPSRPILPTYEDIQAEVARIRRVEDQP